MPAKIQIRRGTAAEATAANVVLAAGELGVETDTRFFKFGDGVTAWRDLPYGTTPDVAGAIADPTPNTIVKRDHNGNFFVRSVYATSPQGIEGTAITRRDFVEERDRWVPNFQTGNYTFVLADEVKHVLSNGTAAQTFTIPANATAAFPIGVKIQVSRWNTGALTLSPASGVTINAVNTTRTFSQYESALLVKVATDSWLIVDLVTTGTESVQGVLELATDAETTTGTDATRATHPRGTMAAIRSVARWAASFKTANYTFALADEMNHILSDGATNVTFTVPANATAAFAIGARVQVTRWGTGTLTLAPASGVTIQGTSGVPVLNQFESLTLVKTHTDTWLIVDMATPASETVAGVVELATTTEVSTGTDTTRAVTPAGLKTVADTKAPISQSEGFVIHDGTATGPARPTGYARVRWVSPPGTTHTRPTNMVAGDAWERDA